MEGHVQLFVVEAQKMEYGGMEILEGNGVDGRAIGDLIGFSVGYAWLYATSVDPGGKGSGVVVAPNIFSFIGVVVSFKNVSPRIIF